MSPKKVLRQAVERTARALGVRLIPEWRMDSYLLSERLKRIIAEYRIDCIFDVGANVGQYHDFLRTNVEFEGLIVSFEPDPESFGRLKASNAMDRNWEQFDCALGRERTRRDFHVMKESAFNSFLDPDESATSLFEDGNSIVRTIRIEIRRLDEVWVDINRRHEIRNVFLKMDTQGFDLEVLEGASGCLDRIHGMQTEVSVTPIYKEMPTFETSLRTFRSKGFEVSGLYSLSEARFPHAIEFDCIYLPRDRGASRL